ALRAKSTPSMRSCESPREINGQKPVRKTRGPSVITDDMLHTVLRRRANGESVEQIQPDLIIPTGKRKGQNPSVASIYRALAEHAKHEAYPEAVAQAQAHFAVLQDAERHRDGVPNPRPAERVGLH
ncbi:hypothetical protein PV416_47460, partial [Streptomyces ipomoeae]|nr:hypothetical protein [Streptomyces ipomoeae]